MLKSVKYLHILVIFTPNQTHTKDEHEICALMHIETLEEEFTILRQGWENCKSTRSDA